MSVLAKIAAYKREEILQEKTRTPIADLLAKAQSAQKPRGFYAALQRAKKAQRPGLIGEIKKASPSKGMIRSDFNVSELARAYERGGASCLSVLTDGPSFQGAPQHLIEARESSSLPILRKDFILDVFQVIQSRAIGADCILVIMAIVDANEAAELAACARDWQMDCILEVHDEGEIERALKLNIPMIGINNRNLATFETDITTAIRLAKLVPADRLVIAESGLSSPDQLRALAQAGITSYLIGESIMRKDNVEGATRMLLEGAA